MRDIIDVSVPSRTPWPPRKLAGARPMRQIAHEMAVRHELTLEDLKGPDRSKRIARVRFAAMAAIRHQTGFSFPQIGAFFGGRDHTTVMHAIRRASGATAVEAKASRALAQQEVA